MEMLLLHDVFRRDFHEQFRGELRQGFEFELFAARYGIADLVISDVVQADNIAGDGFGYHFPVIRQKLCRLGQLERFTGSG